MRDVAGRFVAQVTRVLGWYDDLCHPPEPAPLVTVVRHHRGHEIPTEEEGSMNVSSVGDGLLVRISNYPDQASATLGAQGAEDFVSGLEAMLATDMDPLKGRHFMVGRDDGDGDRLGPGVSDGNMGDPYREVVNFKIVGPGWKTYSRVQVLRHHAHDLAKECRTMLDGPEPEPTGPGMR